MTGPQHYREAERLLETQAQGGEYGESASTRLKRAHVHAMLAVAASNVLPSHVVRAKLTEGASNIDPEWDQVLTPGLT